MTIIQFGMFLIILCALIEGVAQTCLKKSTLSAGSRLGWISGGVILFAAEAGLYTYALQWIDISTAYPLGALCFVAVAILSRWLLAESITPQRWMGIGLIMAGCTLIAL